MAIENEKIEELFLDLMDRTEKTVSVLKQDFSAVRAGRVADHAARTGKYNPYAARMNYLLPAVLLAAILCAPQNQAHIGLLGEYYCKVVIEESKKLLSRQTVQFITGVSIPIFT